jgi:hypothetical protein
MSRLKKQYCPQPESGRPRNDITGSTSHTLMKKLLVLRCPAGVGNTNPRLSLKQQAQVRLSAQGFAWMQREFEAALSRQGRLPEADLARLDWPNLPPP